MLTGFGFYVYYINMKTDHKYKMRPTAIYNKSKYKRTMQHALLFPSKQETTNYLCTP